MKQHVGFSNTEIVIALLIIGVIASIGTAIIVPNINHQANGTKFVTEKQVNVTTVFDNYRTEKGLIPRTEGPSQVLLTALNHQDNTTNVTVSEAQAFEANCALELPAQKAVLNDGTTVYVSDNWMSAPSSRNDYTVVCTQSKNTHTLIESKIEREGNTKNHLANAQGNDNGHETNTGTTDDTGTQPGGGTVVVGHDHSIFTPEDPPIPVTITPKFVSFYTGAVLTPRTYSGVATCTDSGTIAFTTPFDVKKNDTCNITLNSVDSGDSKILMSSTGSPVTVIAASDKTVALDVADSYELALTLEYEANPLKTNVTVNFNSLSETLDLNKKDYTFFLPKGGHSLNVTGSRIKTITTSVATTGVNRKNITVETKQTINILGTLLKSFAESVNAVLAGGKDKKWGTYHELMQNFALTFIGEMEAFGQRIDLQYKSTYRDRKANYIGLGFIDNETGLVSMGGVSSNDINFTPYRAANGQLYYLNKTTGEIYRKGETYWTPVKLTLDHKNAALDSNDQFLFDPDGFAADNVSSVTTPGGLNANEAWLVYDRDGNGIWKNNTLDNDDVFGDHMGKRKNGYEDLQAVFAHEVKTDADGQAYLSLEAPDFWQWLDIRWAKLWGDKTPHASEDLQLLTYDRRLIPAKDVAQRIYVSYKDVKEYDSARKNAIFQRAQVVYTNGKTAESADQYWAFTDGIMQKLDAKEARAIMAEYKKHKK